MGWGQRAWDNPFKPGMDAEIIPDHPLAPDGACWLFNEGSGNLVYDLTGKGNTGTLRYMDPPTDWVPTPYGGGLDFDGLDDEVDCGTFASISSKSAITIHSVIYPRTAKNLMVCAQHVAGTDGCFFLRAGTDCQFTLINAALSRVNYAAGRLISNAWQALTAVYDGATLQMYINGVTVGTGASQTGNINSSLTPLCIGAYNDPSARWNGQMALMYIWLTGLSASQVATFITKPFSFIWVPGQVRVFDMAAGAAAISAKLAASYPASLSLLQTRAATYGQDLLVTQMRPVTYPEGSVVAGLNAASQGETLTIPQTGPASYQVILDGLAATKAATYSEVLSLSKTLVESYGTLLAVSGAPPASYQELLALTITSPIAYGECLVLTRMLAGSYAEIADGLSALLAASDGFGQDLQTQRLASIGEILDLFSQVPASVGIVIDGLTATREGSMGEGLAISARQVISYAELLDLTRPMPNSWASLLPVSEGQPTSYGFKEVVPVLVRFLIALLVDNPLDAI